MPHLDPMSTEEIANNADKIFESISNNLEKFLGAEVKPQQNDKDSKDSFYKDATASTVSDKRRQFAENLALVREGREKLHEAAQESLDSNKLVSPTKHSPQN